jgi:hypothetical protein
MSELIPRYSSASKFYIESRDWTEFSVECPEDMPRDDLKKLRGPAEIDGKTYDVIAIESNCVFVIRKGANIGLIVRGKH